MSRLLHCLNGPWACGDALRAAGRAGTALPHRLNGLGVVLSLLYALGAPVAMARNVALLVAVGQFADPQLRSEQLLGPAADIDSMERVLERAWGFAPADVRSLRDSEATHERILAEISELEQRSRAGDTVLIYFSGHGTSANADNNSFDLPYATGAWVPYDVEVATLAAAQRTLIVGRRDLLPRLKRLDEGGRRVLVLSDSCYSGQVVRAFAQRYSRSRYLRIPSRDLGIERPGSTPSARPPPPPYPYQHVVLLSAASDSEAGADISSPEALQQSPTLDGRYHGAFTDALLRLLTGELLPGQFNYAQAQQALNQFLERHHFAQHPQLLPAIAEDPQDVGSQPFLDMRPSMQAGNHPDVSVPNAAQRDGRVRVRLEAVSAELRARISAVDGVSVADDSADLIVRQRGKRVQLLDPAEDPIADISVGDPTLIKRIAAQVWVQRALPSGGNGLGLRAETDPGSRGNTYVQCESFVFEVRLQRPAWVMLLDLDSQGNLTVLYPTKAAERQPLQPGQPRALPGPDPKDRIVVTPPFGSDQVAVLAFEQRPAVLDELSAQRFASSDPQAAALARGLAAAAGAVQIQKITVNTYPGSGGPFCAF